MLPKSKDNHKLRTTSSYAKTSKVMKSWKAKTTIKTSADIFLDLLSDNFAILNINLMFKDWRCVRARSTKRLLSTYWIALKNSPVTVPSKTILLSTKKTAKNSNLTNKCFKFLLSGSWRSAPSDISLKETPRTNFPISDIKMISCCITWINRSSGSLTNAQEKRDL